MGYWVKIYVNRDWCESGLYNAPFFKIYLHTLFFNCIASHENPIFEGDSQFWDIVEYPKMGIYNSIVFICYFASFSVF